MPYAYHPYAPYYWGPAWHPPGFFIGAMAATAISINVANAAFMYDQGVFYAPSGGGFTVVEAPVGAAIVMLPRGYSSVVSTNGTYYYFGGTFYMQQDGNYLVIPPPPGAIITQLPSGAKQVKQDGQTYMKYNGTLYQPVLSNGVDAYQVVVKS